MPLYRKEARFGIQQRTSYGGWTEDGVAVEGKYESEEKYEMDMFVHMACARRT